MKTISATNARKDIYSLVDEVNESHKAIQISSKRKSAVLIGEDDYNAMQETLFLLSIPNMRESLLEAKNDDLSNFADEDALGW